VLTKYGIVYSNNTQPFDVALCIVYGIPYLFQSQEEAESFAKKKGLIKYRIEPKDVVMRHVKYIIEYFSGYRIPVVRNERVVSFMINEKCKSFSQLYPIIVKLAEGDLRDLRRKRKQIKRVKFSSKG